MVQIHSPLLSFFHQIYKSIFFSEDLVKETSSERFWEIDFLRGIAIILMVGYHFLFDLTFFEIYSTDLSTLPVLLFLYPIGTLFLLLVGISLTISYSRAQKILSKQQVPLKFLKRGASVFGFGLIITLVTWVYPHNGFIIFGVLHCIGLSILLAYPLLRFRSLPFMLGILCIIFGIYLRVIVVVDFPWLLWLGFTPAQFYTLDYFPLLPWFGVVLLGIFLGNRLYQNDKRLFPLQDYSSFVIVRGTCLLGRHSLIIYLLHQLIIIGVLYLLFLY
jgi:uncharacterized membrane protein